MRSGNARVSRKQLVGRTCRDQRKPSVEAVLRAPRILDQFDRTVPHGGNGARVTDRDERRQSEAVPMVPALGDDFGTDPSGVAEGDSQRLRGDR